MSGVVELGGPHLEPSEGSLHYFYQDVYISC
jgi:hypothetical protein